MKHIQQLLVATVAAAVLAVSSTAAGQAQNPDKPAKWGAVGQQVMLSSCVEKGMKDDTFILTNVADVPVHPATMGRVVYWLDETKDLKKHIGHQIRVTGKVTEVKQSEMEVKAGDDGQGGWYVEIEGPGKDVRTPAAKVGATPSSPRGEANDIKTTLVKLKVEEVTMTAASCPTR
jgi:hypothetical protein